ncbi:DUF433 domain-containing protein [uncultured Hymenobacter sp.]|uniref:DUF433 domain-containing protein n=1 Tax=uncultured Hymenobacter sp. TaxID=170016 RepID=UPI0035C9D2FD
MATPISLAHPRITRDYDICHGQDVVRGLRYPVWSVLEYLSSGMSEAEILADYEDLEAEDLRACQAYAAAILKKISHTLAGDGTRRAVTKQEMLAHLIKTGKVPPGTVLDEKGQLPKPQ